MQAQCTAGSCVRLASIGKPGQKSGRIVRFDLGWTCETAEPGGIAIQASTEPYLGQAWRAELQGLDAGAFSKLKLGTDALENRTAEAQIQLKRSLTVGMGSRGLSAKACASLLAEQRVAANQSPKTPTCGRDQLAPPKAQHWRGAEHRSSTGRLPGSLIARSSGPY